jgi:hypothetical protein
MHEGMPGDNIGTFTSPTLDCVGDIQLGRNATEIGALASQLKILQRQLKLLPLQTAR